jgi:hypothetical protein
MSGRALNAISLLALLIVSRSVHGQVICQFTPNYVLAAPVQHPEPNVFLGASFSYALDSVNQWAAGADVAYHPSPALALGVGAAYCDPKFDLDPKPMFGASVTWSTAVSADRTWAVSGAVAVSYVAIDLGSTTQKEVAAPAIVAIHYTRGRLRAYTGGMIQYGRSWTTVTTIRSTIDPGGVAGVEIQLSRTLAAGAGYNFLWLKDASGNTGFLDRAGLRLRYGL